MSLNTAGQLVIGSKTMTLRSGSAEAAPGHRTRGDFRNRSAPPIRRGRGGCIPLRTLDDGQVIHHGRNRLAGLVASHGGGRARTPDPPGALRASRSTGTLVSVRTDGRTRSSWVGVVEDEFSLGSWRESSGLGADDRR